MRIKVKFLKYTVLAVIVSATLVAVLDSCDVLTDRFLYAVNEPQCIGCKKCLSVCPQNAISIIDGKAIIDKQKCIGCGRCPGSCSEKAIYAIPESK